MGQSCCSGDVKIEATIHTDSRRMRKPFGGLPADEFWSTFELSANSIGSGSFSIVKVAMNKQNHQQFAVKIIDKKGLSNMDLQSLYKETVIMKKLDHPNVVKFFDYYEDKFSLFVILQYCAGGDLFDRIVTRPSFTEEDAKMICKTVTKALKYCSDLGVTHRDIKPDNILLLEKEDDWEKLVVADFGFAIQIEPELKGFELLQTMCGTRAYVAPEVISGKNYNYKCDIWSLGVITFIILSGYSPFNVNMPELRMAGSRPSPDLVKKKNQELLKLVRRAEWDFIPQEAWDNVSAEAKDFLRKVMCKDVNARFDYNQMLAHEWLRSSEVNVVELDLEPLKKLNAQRKVLAAAKARQAANVFTKLMSSSKFNAVSEIFADEAEEKKKKRKNDVKELSVGAFVEIMESDNESDFNETFG